MQDRLARQMMEQILVDVGPSAFIAALPQSLRGEGCNALLFYRRAQFVTRLREQFPVGGVVQEGRVKGIWKGSGAPEMRVQSGVGALGRWWRVR